MTFCGTEGVGSAEGRGDALGQGWMVYQAVQLMEYLHQSDVLALFLGGFLVRTALRFVELVDAFVAYGDRPALRQCQLKWDGSEGWEVPLRFQSRSHAISISGVGGPLYIDGCANGLLKSVS